MIGSHNRDSLSRRLTIGTLNYGLASVLPKILGFALLPLYTLFLTPADYGIVEIVSTLIAFLVVIMRLGLPGAVTRSYFAPEASPAALNDLVTTIALTMNVASTLVGALCAVVLWAASDTILPGVAAWPFGAIAIVSAVLTSNTDLQRRLVQAREQSAYSMKLSLITAVVNAVLAVVFVALLKGGPVGLLGATLVANLVFFVQARRYLAPNLRGSFRFDLLAGASRYGLAILPSHIVGNIAPIINRSVLAATQSLAAVGVFGVASRFASPLALLATAFGTAYLPIYFEHRASGSVEATTRLLRTAEVAWLGACAAFLVTITVGPPAVALMTHGAFGDAGLVLTILASGFLAQVVHTLLGPELFYAKTPWVVPIVSLCGAATTVVLTWILAPRWSAVGLAVAQSVGLVTIALLSAAAAQRLHRIPYRWSELAKPVLSVAAAALPIGLLPRAESLLDALVVLPSAGIFVLALLALRSNALRVVLARRTAGT